MNSDLDTSSVWAPACSAQFINERHVKRLASGMLIRWLYAGDSMGELFTRRKHQSVKNTKYISITVR